MGQRAHFNDTERGPFKPGFGLSGVVRKASQGKESPCGASAFLVARAIDCVRNI
jgi:hypothetical protein